MRAEHPVAPIAVVVVAVPPLQVVVQPRDVHDRPVGEGARWLPVGRSRQEPLVLQHRHVVLAWHAVLVEVVIPHREVRTLIDGVIEPLARSRVFLAHVVDLLVEILVAGEADPAVGVLLGLREDAFQVRVPKGDVVDPFLFAPERLLCGQQVLHVVAREVDTEVVVVVGDRVLPRECHLQVDKPVFLVLRLGRLQSRALSVLVEVQNRDRGPVDQLLGAEHPRDRAVVSPEAPWQVLVEPVEVRHRVAHGEQQALVAPLERFLEAVERIACPLAVAGRRFPVALVVRKEQEVMLRRQKGPVCPAFVGVPGVLAVRALSDAYAVVVGGGHRFRHAEQPDGRRKRTRPSDSECCLHESTAVDARSVPSGFTSIPRLDCLVCVSVQLVLGSVVVEWTPHSCLAPRTSLS
jgi:hypothetical protein